MELQGEGRRKKAKDDEIERVEDREFGKALNKGRKRHLIITTTKSSRFFLSLYI